MTHNCPWPNCPRRVDDRHWGCIEHWNLVPNALRIALRKAENGGNEIHTHLARADITQWIDENQNAADVPQAMTIQAAADDEVDFAAGITGDGRVFMLWPRRGEFSTPTKDESAIVVKAICAMLAPAA